MARPIKQGIDYFSFDVHLDDKFKFIEIKYGLEGFAIVIKLLQKIYSGGYWCSWSDDELLLFSNEIRSDADTVKGVVNECLRRGLLNKELYEKHGILTSKGIQKRYKEATRRRKDIEIIDDYLLIDDMETSNYRQNDGKNGVNDNKNPTNYRQNDGKSTQTKVNKTKGNNTTTFSDASAFYQKNFGVLNGYIGEDIGSWCDDLSPELAIEAMKRALEEQKSWGYAKGILKNWHDKNLTTITDIEAEERSFRNKKQSSPKNNLSKIDEFFAKREEAQQ